MKEKYTPGEGCQCSARCSCECGCDVDWTPREVYELREQRDRLLAEREQWRMSSVCRELREQRDRLAEAMRHFMSDTPETDAEHAQFPMGGFTLDFARKLERERDRLAEALREIDEARLDDFMGPHDMALKCVLIARESLAAVKGGTQ